MSTKKIKTDIPKSCSVCDRKYTVKERTNYHLQTKSKIIFILSILSSFTLNAIVVGTDLFEEAMSSFKLYSVFILLPAFIGVCYAYNLPRLLILRCAKCKHIEKHYIEIKNKFKAKEHLIKK